MKTAVYILIALLGGLMLGSWSIKADLRKATSEIDRLKTQLAQKGSQPASVNGITSMLNLPEVKPTAKPEPLTRSRHKHFPPPPAPTTNILEGTASSASNAPTVHNGSDTNSRMDQFETAANLWKVRVDLARNSFISAVTSNDEQAMQFDVSMAAMNLRLSNSIRTWVDQIKADETLSPEKSIRMFNDLSSTLVWAYKDLDRTQPADWREKAGPKFQVLDFINPEVARPLIEADGIFNRRNRSLDDHDFSDSADSP